MAQQNAARRKRRPGKARASDKAVNLVCTRVHDWAKAQIEAERLKTGASEAQWLRDLVYQRLRSLKGIP